MSEVNPSSSGDADLGARQALLRCFRRMRPPRIHFVGCRGMCTFDGEDSQPIRDIVDAELASLPADHRLRRGAANGTMGVQRCCCCFAARGGDALCLCVALLLCVVVAAVVMGVAYAVMGDKMFF